MSSLRIYFLTMTMSIAALISWKGVAAADFSPFQPLPKEPPVPQDNLQTSAKIELGKQLFFDPRLSINGSVSCNACHNVMAGGEDGRSVSLGAIKAGHRSAPTLWNVAFQTIYYWDGRAVSLEESIKMHFFGPDEMGMASPAAVVERINAVPDYVNQFTHVFGRDGLSYDNIAKAIAAYIRTLITPDSPFDRFLNGDEKAIADVAKRGFNRFIDTGCASCHFWVNLSGPVPGLAFKMGEGFYELFPNYLGSDYDKKYALIDDVGRSRVTGDENDRYLWRVQSLRNVAITAPYFHNGSVSTLEEAVKVMAKTQLNKDLAATEIMEIVAFLNTLTGKFPEQTLPRLPETKNRSVLTVGNNVEKSSKN